MRSDRISAPRRRRLRASTDAADRIEAGLHLFGDPSGKRRRQGIGIKRSSQPDTRRRLQFQGRSNQQAGFRERIGDGQARTAAAGKTERARFSAPLGYAVWERGSEKRARLAGGFSVIRDAHPPAVLVSGLTDAVQGGAIGVGVAVCNRGEAGCNIGGVLVSQWVSLLQQRGEDGGEGALFRCAGGQHHRCQPGMPANPSHFAANGGDAALGVKRAEILQQRDGSGERAGRRSVLKRQIGRRRPPGGAFQHQAGQFCFQNFRTVEGGQTPV